MYYNNYIFIKTKRETKTPRTAEESFYYFLKHSIITLLADYSAYSFVFKCRFRLKPNLSPYFYMNIHGEMENVLNIVIKISLVSEKKSKNKWEYRTCSTNEDTIQYYNTPYHFFNEINIQSEISELGLLNLNRNTPILLFSKLYSYHSNNYKVLKDVLSKKADKNGKYIINQLFTEFHKIHKEKTDDNFYFAIIGMEYIVPEYVLYCDIVKPIINDIKSDPGNENIHKYDNMSLAKFSARLKTIYNIARYELLRIAVDTGYSQGDYHTENLLLYEEAQEIMVIDFGNAKTIPHYTHLKNNWEYLEENKFVINKDTFRILKEILCDIYNTHYKDSEENSKEYQWLKHIDEEDMEIIGTIHHFRVLKSMKKNTQIFDMYLSAKRSEYLFQNMAFIDDDYRNHCLGYFWKKIFGKR
jgi:hypothetical protein